MGSQAVFGAVFAMPFNWNRSHNGISVSASMFAPVTRSLSTREGLRNSQMAMASTGLEKLDCKESLERCLSVSSSFASGPCFSSPSMPAQSMKARHGAVTLEKSKLDLARKKAKTILETATGDGGGDIGKGISHGGGGGGDDHGDDDDYFDDFDEGDDDEEGGLFRRRRAIHELFDRKFLNAVMEEWHKTMMDLPLGLHQACEMGLVSSAQMVRLLVITARPSTARFIFRALPQLLSRAFIGRMIADPFFLYKLLLEQIATIGCATWWELKTRKERIQQEWDLALVNVLTASVCTAFVVWSLAPSRSYGNIFRFNLQNTIQKLPNNIFEKSYPLREFNLQKRIQSFLYKTAELWIIGLAAGAGQGILSKYFASGKKSRVSVIIPNPIISAISRGSFLGFYANMRYQLLHGLDRGIFEYFDVLGVVMVLSAVLRLMNIQLGEASRLAWLGTEVDPLVASDNLSNAYKRHSTAASPTEPTWFISKDTIVSRFRFFDGSATRPRSRRKRVIGKKMTAPA